MRLVVELRVLDCGGITKLDMSGNVIPEKIHVLTTRLAIYIPSDSTTAKSNHLMG